VHFEAGFQVVFEPLVLQVSERASQATSVAVHFCVTQLMSSVEPHTRGAASGILSMLNNTGQMLSIVIVFPLALSHIPFTAIQQVFINGGGMGRFSSAIPPFLAGLHQAFLVSFGLSIIAAVVAALRPSH